MQVCGCVCVCECVCCELVNKQLAAARCRAISCSVAESQLRETHKLALSLPKRARCERKRTFHEAGFESVRNSNFEMCEFVYNTAERTCYGDAVCASVCANVCDYACVCRCVYWAPFHYFAALKHRETGDSKMYCILMGVS